MPVTEPELSAAEAALGVAFPRDYRDSLCSTDGSLEERDEVYLDLWPLKAVVDINTTDAYGFGEWVPGLLIVGSNGGGEMLCLDLRPAMGHVYLVPAASASWDAASLQASSFSALLDHVRAGGALRFE